jgi:hypothetical protein
MHNTLGTSLDTDVSKSALRCRAEEARPCGFAGSIGASALVSAVMCGVQDIGYAEHKTSLQCYAGHYCFPGVPEIWLYYVYRAIKAAPWQNSR